MLHKSKVLSLVALCVFAVLVTAADVAADGGTPPKESSSDAASKPVKKPVMPEIKEGKVLSDCWYNIFLEGKKIGYEHERKVQAEVLGKKVVVCESTEKLTVKIDGNAQTSISFDKCVMLFGSYEPLYFVRSLKYPGFDYSAEGAIEKSKGGYKINVVKTLNGKTEHKSADIEEEGQAYFQFGAICAYMDDAFKKGEDCTFSVLDVELLDSDLVYVRYIGECRL